tara:strand:+ start:1526 stop:1825 length:300 start_codon:yes stop_codon:yes gene_type:complete
MNYVIALTPSDKGFQQIWETVMQSVAILKGGKGVRFSESGSKMKSLCLSSQLPNHTPQNLPDVGTNPPLKKRLQRGENLSLLEREALWGTTYPYFFFKS